MFLINASYLAAICKITINASYLTSYLAAESVIVIWCSVVKRGEEYLVIFTVKFYQYIRPQS